jgi:hypothetical protein
MTPRASMRTGTSVLWRVAALALGLVLAPGVHAAEDDHLKCYKIRDPARFEAALTLTNVFGADTCVVRAPARLFCEQTRKLRCAGSHAPCEDDDDCPSNCSDTRARACVVDTDCRPPQCPTCSPSETCVDEPCGDDPRGERVGDYLCYKLRHCTGQVPDERDTNDQFGQRVIHFKGSRLLCVLASKHVCGDDNLDPGEDCDPPGNDTQCPDDEECTAQCLCPASPSGAFLEGQRAF